MTQKDRILANASRFEQRGKHHEAGVLRKLAGEEIRDV